MLPKAVVLVLIGIFARVNTEYSVGSNAGRVVGGIETTIEKFPYQVGINFLGGLHCGGALCRTNVAITAAHCVYDYPPALLSVFAGTSSRINIQNGVKSEIKRFIVHESYNPKTYDFNIALVILEDRWDFSDSLQPVALPGKDEKIPAGSKAFIAGWGTLTETGNLPVTIHYAPVSIIERAECQKAYEGVQFISPAMLCATGNVYGGTDPCVGDFGSPLVTAGKIYGIVSYSQTCTKRNQPRIYTNVAYLRRWIDQNLL